jgi:hypothetical protein
MLINLQDAFHQTIYENSSYYCFENISKNLAWLKEVYISVVDLKVLFKWESNKVINLSLFSFLLSDLLFFPWFQLLCVFLALELTWLLLLIKNVLLEAKETDKFSEEFVLSKQTFCLVRVKRQEIFLGNIFLSTTFWYIVLLEHSVLDQVRIRNVVKNSIS